MYSTATTPAETNLEQMQATRSAPVYHLVVVPTATTTTATTTTTGGIHNLIDTEPL